MGQHGITPGNPFEFPMHSESPAGAQLTIRQIRSVYLVTKYSHACRPLPSIELL